jgi:hypothetical protein
MFNKKKVPFTFEIPSGWEDQTVYTFRGPKIDEHEHMLILNITRKLQHEDIYHFAREWIDPMVNTLQGLDILKEEEITIEDGNPAYEFVCRWTPADNVAVIKKYVFVFMYDMGFTFSCDFSKKSYKMLSGQLKDFIDSLLPGTYEPYEED